MKPIPFELNDNNMSFQYVRTRNEGPNYFLCYYKHKTVLRQDPKDAWRVLEVSKFTDTGKALKEWCLDMDNKYNSDEIEPRVDTSFASEVQQEVEPNDNTKMVT